MCQRIVYEFFALSRYTGYEDFPAYARLPYTAGPGMPGPYRTFLLPPPRRGGFFHFYVNFTRSPLARRTNILYN